MVNGLTPFLPVTSGESSQLNSPCRPCRYAMHQLPCTTNYWSTLWPDRAEYSSAGRFVSWTGGCDVPLGLCTTSQQGHEDCDDTAVRTYNIQYSVQPKICIPGCSNHKIQCHYMINCLKCSRYWLLLSGYDAGLFAMQLFMWQRIVQLTLLGTLAVHSASTPSKRLDVSASCESVSWLPGSTQ